MENKIRNLILTIILTIILIIPTVTASTFQQYSPSPTTNNIYDVVVATTGDALAITGSGTNYLFYDYSTGNWQEISAPSGASGYTYLELEKTNDGKIWLMYESGANQRIIEFDPSTVTFTTHSTLIGRIPNLGVQAGFVCIYESGSTYENECFMLDRTSHGGKYYVWRVVPSLQIEANTTTEQSGLIKSNNDLMGLKSGFPSNKITREFNGVSWVTRHTSHYSGADPSTHVYVSSTQQSLSYPKSIYNDYGMNFYNITVGQYQEGFTDASAYNVIYDGTKQYFQSGSGTIRSVSYFGKNTSSADTTAINTLYNLDFDLTTGTGWAVGAGGIIYEYLGAGGADVLTVGIYTIENPIDYGEEAEFRYNAVSSQANQNNITINFYDTGYNLIKTWNHYEEIGFWGTNGFEYSIFITDGATANNEIDWNELDGIGTYYVRACGYARTSGAYDCDADVQWEVTAVGGATYSLTTSILTSPIYYGSPAGYNFKATHSGSETSDVKVWWEDSLGSTVHEENFYGMTSGTTYVGYIEESDWNHFTAGQTYTMHAETTSTGTSAYTTATNKTWNVQPSTITYTLTSSATNNPAIYGEDTSFKVKATHSDGEQSNITLEFYDSLTMNKVYEWNVYEDLGFYATNGIQYTVIIDDDVWSNLQTPRTYIITTNTNSIPSDDNTQANNITWYIEGIAVQNITEYNATKYVSETSGIIEINSLYNPTNTNAYSIGQNNTDSNNLFVLSYDSALPNNIIRKKIDVPTDTGRDLLTGIATYGEKLFLGTDDGLYIFNDSANNDASTITFDQSYEWGGIINPRDYIWDVEELNTENSVAVCRKGWINDDLRIIDTTTMTDLDTISVDPCLDLKYDYYSDLITVHSGTDGIYFYEVSNFSNITQQGHLDTVTGISGEATNDLIDTIDDKNLLFAITGYNTIKVYNITVPLFATEIYECRADRNIISIEALDENTILMGTQTGIKVCDLTNQETYDIAGNFYVAQQLVTLNTGEIPHVIESYSADRFHVAQDKNYAVYGYQKSITEEEINSPPSITEITASYTTPEREQTVFFNIIASDIDGDDLTYDWDCDGAKSEMENNYLIHDFTCSWTTSGVKNVKVFVNDGYHIIQEVEQVTVQTTIFDDYTINLKIIDDDTGYAVEQVKATILTTGAIGYTDSQGLAIFAVEEYQQYSIKLEKNGYYTRTINVYPNQNLMNVIISSSTGDQTTLIIKTEDSTGTGLQGSLVSVSNPLTGQNQYGFTDATGEVTLTNMFTGDKLILSASNEDEGYEYTSTYTSLEENEVKTITLTLTSSLISTGAFPATSRKCADTIKGVFLCGNLSTTGIGSRCEENSDCISGRCMIATTPEGKKCSTFNYTICDEKGINRGNICIFQATMGGGLKMLGNSILNNFLYVLIILFLIILGLMVRHNLKR